MVINELKQREALSKQYLNQPKDWWINKIDDLRKISESGAALERESAKRTLNYIGIISYSYTERLLQENNEELLLKALFIYSYIEPENPDMFFYYSCYYAKKGENNTSLQMLEKAIEKGFNNQSKVLSGPYFKSLLNNARFIDLVSKMK